MNDLFIDENNPLLVDSINDLITDINNLFSIDIDAINNIITITKISNGQIFQINLN